MPLFVIQMRCPHCGAEHPSGIVLKLDDGPLTKESVKAYCADRPPVPELALKNTKLVCPVTGEPFVPPSDEDVLIVPQPYRF